MKLIDADYVINRLEDRFGGKYLSFTLDNIIHILRIAPVVEPVQHLGEWIVRRNIKIPLSQAYIRNEKTFECSCCGELYRKHMNYCGNCGAKMSGKDVEE